MGGGDASFGGGKRGAVPTHEASARVGSVLVALVRNGPDGTGVRELANELRSSRSAVHRILQVLSELGVAHASGDGRYEPGAQLLAWSGFLAERHPILRFGHQILTDLTRQTQETALLITYRTGDLLGMTIASCEYPKPVRYTIMVGTPTPLFVGSAGRAIVAHLPEDGVGPDGPPGRPNPAHLEASPAAPLDATRRLGYAVTVGERIPEAAGVASPFFRSGVVAGAINVTVPQYRVDEPQLRAYGEVVRAAAARLSEVLASHDQEATDDDEADDDAADTHTTSGLDAHRADGGLDGAEPAEGRAVSRVIGILDALARHPARGRSTPQLAVTAGVKAATVHRMLDVLAQLGLAYSAAPDRWEAGPQLLILPALLGQDGIIARIKTEILSRLVAASDETACVFAYDETQADGVFEAVYECSKPIRYAMPVGARAPLYAGAAGKAILAHCDGEALAAQQLERVTDATIVDPDDLRRDLAATVERGYAVSLGERIPEAAGVAAAYFHGGQVAGAVTVSIPRYRFDPDLVPDLGRLVTVAAAELTLLLSTTAASGPVPADGPPSEHHQ